jgi:RHS repeat-associated protein
MTSEPGLPALPSTPDAGNRYLNVGGTPWIYDLEGRLLADGARTFGYDGDGLLCEENDAGQPASAGFLRDAMGRVLACKTDAGIDYLVYAGRILVARFGAAAPLEAVPGRYADEPLHLAQAGSDTWVIQDGLRTPRLLLRRGPGQVDVVLSHRPFGSIEGAPFAEIPFGFAGMLALPGSMLFHAARRSYRSDIGRFLQQDPVGFADGANRYVYAQNNPLALFDPLGLQSLNPSDLRIFEVLEKYAGELLKDVTHNKLTPSVAGMNKHLELQFATGHIPITELSDADSLRVAPEIHINDKGVIVGVDLTPDRAKKVGSARTVDIGIVKEGVPGGRDGIVGKKAEDVLDFAIDYKSTGKAGLDKRKELEVLLGGKPVVKLTGKVGELAQALTKRFAHLAAAKAVKQAAEKKAAKWGLKQIPKAIPILGAIFTYSTAEGSQGERIARAAAGEIGAGPFDLEALYDVAQAAGGVYLENAEWYKERGMDPPPMFPVGSFW